MEAKWTSREVAHSGKGPAEYFTGTVRIDPLFQTADPARSLGVSVTFEPGARTAWHTHPLGQTLIVTAIQDNGIQRYRPPDGTRIVSGQRIIASEYLSALQIVHAYWRARTVRSQSLLP